MRLFAVFGCLAVITIAANNVRAQEPLPGPSTANVVGTWTLSCRNWNGSRDTKTVQLRQNDTQITGHFKGPNQSGGLEGTVNGRHIMFRTKTRTVLTFRGQVDGDTMQGNFHVRGKTGQFQGYRSSPKP
jgi:hypothetical protein